MADLWNQILTIARPSGTVPTLLALFCIFLAWQLERERRERTKEREDIMALIERLMRR
ncbi:MAG TPA: hypothetical protein VGR84_18805 [Candidatus Acidoferrales bacterium]|nr:hypothetical protein [Candidatus Acidoferrales bacterium]